MKTSELIRKLKTLQSLYGDLPVQTDFGEYPSMVADVVPQSEKGEKMKIVYFEIYSRMKGPGE